MKKPRLTVEQVVSIVNRKGQIQINPLSERDSGRVKKSLFRAAEMGLISKQRINCGCYIFSRIHKEP